MFWDAEEKILKEVMWKLDRDLRRGCIKMGELILSVPAGGAYFLA